MAPKIQCYVSSDRVFEEGPGFVNYSASIQMFLRRATARLRKVYPGTKVSIQVGVFDSIKITDLPGVKWLDIEKILNEEDYSNAWLVFAKDGRKTVAIERNGRGRLFTLPAQPMERAIELCKKSSMYMQKDTWCIPDQFGKVDEVEFKISEESFAESLDETLREKLDLRQSFLAYLAELKKALESAFPGAQVSVEEGLGWMIGVNPAESCGCLVTFDIQSEMFQNQAWRIWKPGQAPDEQPEPKSDHA